MFSGLMKSLGSFGTIPDILMGKDPEEALLDNLAMAALVGTGMYAAPMLSGLGSAGAAASPGLLGTGATQSGLLAAQEAGLGASSLGWGGATTGMQGALNSALGAEAGAGAGGLLGQASNAVGTAGKIAQPVGQAMQVAQSMGGNDQPLPAPPPPQLPTQRMDVSGLLGYGQQQRQYDDQEAERRKQMMQMYANRIGGMG